MGDGTDGNEIGWYSEEAATFGDRLAAAREAMGMGQGELAQKLGVEAKRLARWEDDLSEPRANRLTMLSGMLGVSMRWLMTGHGEGPDGPEAEGGAASSDVPAILREMRSLRVTIETSAHRLGKLEKRLSKTVLGE